MNSTDSGTERCRALRRALLDLHRALIDLERRGYEKQWGAQSAGDFLQVVAFSDEMRWLEPLTRLIVMLDESIDADSPDVTQAVVTTRIREVLNLDRSRTDEFSVRYLAHFDASPDLAAAHAKLLAALKPGAS